MARFHHVAAVSATVVAIVGASHAQTLTWESGSPTGTESMIGQVMATYGDMDMQLNTGQVATRSCMRLGRGEIDIAICPQPAHKLMISGKGPYKDETEAAAAAAENIRGLLAFSAGFFHPIARGGSYIETWDDLHGLRVFTGAPAGAVNHQSEALIEIGSGFKAGVDYESVRMGWDAALQAFQDGQFDFMMFPTAAGNAALEQLGSIHILDLPKDADQTEAWKIFATEDSRRLGSIPSGTYSNLTEDRDIRAAEFGMQVAVNVNMDDDTAYTLTRAFWENLPEAQKNIRVMNMIDAAEPFRGISVRLHPGAVRYYEEQGFEIPVYAK